jgi:signal transduction histidine kinase
MEVVGESLLQTTYVVVFGVAALGCLAALPRARQIEDRGTRLGLLGLLAGSSGWAASHALLFLGPSPGLSRLIYLGGLILGFSTVFSWLYFCSAYTGRVYHRKRLPLALGGALFLGVAAVKLTNPLHRQYFTAEFVTTPFPHLEIQQQLFHWLVTGLSYSLAAVGLFMLFELVLEADQDTRPLGLLAGVTVLPVVFDVTAYALPGLVNVIHAPLGVAAFAVGVLYVFDERFLTVQVASEVDGPLVFLDGEDRIREFTVDAERLLPGLASHRGDPIETVPALADATGEETTVLDFEVDGDRRHFLATTREFPVGQTDVDRLLLFSEVTDLERQRRELGRHNAQLEAFAGGLRHELLNATQIVLGHIQTAEAMLDEDPSRARDSLSTAAERSRGMAATINDIASVARQGQTVGDIDTLDFRTVVRAAYGRHDTGDLSLVVEGDGTIRADERRLYSLFERAVEFALRNDATALTVRLTDTGFTIADDGTRPPDENLDRVFDYDGAVPTAKVGMALPTLKTLARTHGWTVRADADYTEGVRVVVDGVTVIQTEAMDGQTSSPSA